MAHSEAGDRDGSSEPDGKKSKRELAQQRTERARERTLLAKERTFAAWLRTGLAAMAVGFGVAELLGEMEPTWLARSIGVALILIGGSLHVIGFLNYRRTLRVLEKQGMRGVPLWVIGTLSTVLVIGALAGVVLILVGGR